MKRLAQLAGMVGICVVASRTASADPTADLTALLKHNIEAVASGDDHAFAATLAKGALVYGGTGVAFDPGDAKDGHHAFHALYGDYASGTATHKLGTPTLVVDAIDGVAWFQAPFDATFKSDMSANPCGGPPASAVTTKMRLSGVAVATDGKWALAAEMFTKPMNDGDLIDLAQNQQVAMPTGAPQLAGDKPAATAIAGWFPKLSQAKTTGKVVVASGSAPGEYFDAAGVAQVQKAWDGLGMMPYTVEAHTFNGGKLAFVRATTAMPIKKTKFASPLTMAAIAVLEGDQWRWVSLQFAPSISNW
jgi:hypothetical protein